MKSKIVFGIGSAFIAILAIMALTLVSTGAVSAQTPTNTPGAATAPNQSTTPAAAGSPVHIMGKISSVSASSVVLTTRNGDVTANIGTDTFIVVNTNGTTTKGAATDLVVGENANVIGEATADAKVINAKTITQGAPFAGDRGPGAANGRGPGARPGAGTGALPGAGAKPGEGAKPGAGRGVGPGGMRGGGADFFQHAAAGTITAINGDTVTLQGDKVAVVNVNTSANTLVLNNGFSTLSSLKVGDKVEVLGAPDRPAASTPGATNTTTQTRTLTAWAIRVDDGTAKLSTVHVATVSGNTVTSNAPRNGTATTVTFDSNTQFKTLTITLAPAANSFTFADATQSAVVAESNIIVEGVASADGKTITAKSVVILPSRDPLKK